LEGLRLEGKVKIAIIGGSGLYQLLRKSEHVILETPFGKTPRIEIGEIEGVKVAFLPRHAKPGSEKVGHDVPPHKINFRANIYGLHMLGVERIIASSACGSLNPAMEPGDFVILDQFIDMTKNRIYTFYDGETPIKVFEDKPPVTQVVHIDFTEPYCPELRSIIFNACEKLKVRFHKRGCYIAVEGPRFETSAEIRAYRLIGGDVVGMTNVPESVLARELGKCYAAIAIVTNWAAGIQEKVSHQEVIELFSRKIEDIRQVFKEVIKNIPVERRCRCESLVREAFF